MKTFYIFERRLTLNYNRKRNLDVGVRTISRHYEIAVTVNNHNI